MKILQLDVNKIEFKLLEPESKTYEKSDKKDVVIDNTLIILFYCFLLFYLTYYIYYYFQIKIYSYLIIYLYN